MNNGQHIIYFVRAGDFVKIGRTSLRRFASRMDHIQVHCPFEAVVAFTVSGDAELELFYHDKFRKHHFRGEWFLIRGELERFLARFQRQQDDMDREEFQRAFGL